MTNDLCSACAIGHELPSGRCDHCDADLKLRAIAEKAHADHLRFNDERNRLFLGEDWLKKLP